MAVSITVTTEEGRDQKQEVQKDINDFERWFMGFLKNGDPLTRHERAILNDFIGWKLQSAGLEKTGREPKPIE